MNQDSVVTASLHSIRLLPHPLVIPSGERTYVEFTSRTNIGVSFTEYCRHDGGSRGSRRTGHEHERWNCHPGGQRRDSCPRLPGRQRPSFSSARRRLWRKRSAGGHWTRSHRITPPVCSATAQAKDSVSAAKATKASPSREDRSAATGDWRDGSLGMFISRAIPAVLPATCGSKAPPRLAVSRPLMDLFR